jgi:hypothetical protein
MSKPKIRATVLDISGQERFEIIKAAMSRFNTALDHNFYLEATALIESLICDRLESRIGELIQKPVQFDTLGNLLKKLNGLEEEESLKKIMNVQINNWTSQRNIVIHQAAKIEFDKKKDWNEFLKLAENAAKEGRKIFDTYNTHLQKIRRTKK